MSMEAYSVAIRLRLIDGVSLGILGLSEKFVGLNTHLGKTHTELSKIETKLKSVKNMMLVGSGMMVGGGIALGMLDGPIKAATAYEVAFQKLKNLNLGETINRQADEFARANKTFGVSSTEMMTQLAEAIGVFPSYAAAMANVGKVAEVNAANKTLYGEGAGDDAANRKGLIKFIERRGGMVGADGKFDQAKYDAAFNLAEKMVTGSGGKITFADLGLFSQQAGTAFRGFSEQGVMDMALAIQEMGASKAGTASMSLFQNLHAGRTPIKTMNLLAAAGLGATHEVTSGTIAGQPSKNLVMDHIKDAQLLQEDQGKWIETVMLPALTKMGNVTEEQIISAMNDLISTRTASSLGTILGTQAPLVHRDANLVKNAADTAAVLKGYEQNPAGSLDDLRTKKDSLEVELGQAALPVLIPILQGLTPVVKGLAALIKEFPTTSKVLVGAFVGLAGLAVVGGAMMNIVGGLRAMGLAMEWFAAKAAASAAAEAGAAGMGGMGIAAAKGGFLRAGVKAAGAVLAGGEIAFAGGAAAIAGTAAIATAVAAATGITAYWLTNKVANDWLGLDSKLGGLFGDNYDPNAKRPNFTSNGAKTAPVVVRSPVFLDGKLISDNTAGHLASAFKPSGGEMFDPTLTPPSVGLNFAR